VAVPDCFGSGRAAIDGDAVVGNIEVGSVVSLLEAAVSQPWTATMTSDGELPSFQPGIEPTVS